MMTGTPIRLRVRDAASPMFEAPTLQEAAAKAGKLPEGAELIYRHLKDDHHDYAMQHDASGGVCLVQRRKASAISPGSTEDQAAGLRRINERNKEFWSQHPPGKAG